MKKLALVSLIASVGFLAVAACSNDTTLGTNGTGSTTGPFLQLDRVGKAQINEIFATFSRHDTNNRDNPSDDGANLSSDIGTFMTSTGGRSAATTAYVQGVLVPDVLVADFTQMTGAGYLGVETSGRSVSGGSTFGGRALTDDAIAIDLGLAFGNKANIYSGGSVPDDGAEKDGRAGTPNLANDNVGPGAKNFQTSFPYLGNPH